MSNEPESLLTTGQAADLCCVKADTVRKWVKRGWLQARQTAGGHHRIRRRDLAPFINAPRVHDSYQIETSPTHIRLPLRCWEYLNQQGVPGDECKSCVVYRIGASRCYEVAVLDSIVGHAKRFCRRSCEECIYYRRASGFVTNVLLVTSDTDFAESVLANRSDEIELRVAHNSYETSALIHTFRPAFVVIDRELPKREVATLLEGLANDPRVPGLKVILAMPKGTRSKASLPEGYVVDGEIDKPFRAAQFLAVLERFPVEALPQEAKQLLPSAEHTTK